MKTIAKIWFILKTSIFKIPIVTNTAFFQQTCFINIITSEISILLYSGTFIRLIQTKYHLEKLADKAYHLL